MMKCNRELFRPMFAVGALMALLVQPSPGEAQTTDQRVGGAVISLNGNGGDITAGGALVTIRGPADNIRVGGAHVDIRSQTSDSVWVGGGRILLDGSIGRDLRAGGAIVELRADTEGDVTVGGVVVDIDARIGGDVRAGAGSLVISRETSIGGSLKGGGASVSVAADVAGDVRLGGAAVTFSGSSGGSVILAGEEITVTGLARIDGNLTIYSRSDPVIAEGAVIGGKIERRRPDERLRDIPGWMVKLGFTTFMAAGTVVAGFIMLLFGAQLLSASADVLRRGPVTSLLVGLLIVVLIPLISLVLLATGVGFSAALALVLTLPLFLVFGHATAATGIAGGLLMGSSARLGPLRALLFLIIGSIVIALAALIPWFGPWLAAIAIVTGVGAFARTMLRRLRRREADRVSQEVEGEAILPPTESAAEPVESAEPETTVENKGGQAQT